MARPCSRSLPLGPVLTSCVTVRRRKTVDGATEGELHSEAVKKRPFCQHYSGSARIRSSETPHRHPIAWEPKFHELFTATTRLKTARPTHNSARKGGSYRFLTFPELSCDTYSNQHIVNAGSKPAVFRPTGSTRDALRHSSGSDGFRCEKSMVDQCLHLFQNYPYLFANIAGIPAVAIAFALMPCQRRMMLYSGAIPSLMSPVAILHDHAYWSPLRIAHGAFGIEDVMFAFLTGSMAWALAALPFRERLSVEIRWPLFLRRFVITGLWGCGLLLGLLFLGSNVMTATLVAQLAVAATICFCRPNLLPMVIVGATSYLCFHIAEISIWFWIWPEFASYWQQTGLWGRTLLGIPLGEWAFTAAFGASVPAFLGYYSDARTSGFPIHPSQQSSRP